MSNFPMMDDDFEVVEQNDGFTSPLQQYESFVPSWPTVTHPDGPLWWDSTAPAEPEYVGDVQVTDEYTGGIVEPAASGFASTVEVVGSEAITVLE